MAGKPGPWTVKGIDQEDRDAINMAARRAQQPVGRWLVETARRRINRERREAEDRFADVRQVPAPKSLGEPGVARPRAPAHDVPASSPSVAELVLVLRDLAEVPRCGQVSARARRLLAAQLAAHLPMASAAHAPSLAGGAMPLSPRPRSGAAGGKPPSRGPGEPVKSAANPSGFGEIAREHRPLLPRPNAEAAEDGS